MIFRHLLNMRSHPTWVRGLKHVMTHNVVMVIMSHPTWVRGLKLYATTQEADQRDVAPYVGAWIETEYRTALPSVPFVAPYVGAWIETLSS